MAGKPGRKGEPGPASPLERTAYSRELQAPARPPSALKIPPVTFMGSRYSSFVPTTMSSRPSPSMSPIEAVSMIFVP